MEQDAQIASQQVSESASGRILTEQSAGANQELQEKPCDSRQLLKRAFFEAPPERVAPRLLGKLLVRRTRAQALMAGRIVEVEAYLGPHASQPTRRRIRIADPRPGIEVLFGPAGHAYVYFIYGLLLLHELLLRDGGPGGVRAAARTGAGGRAGADGAESRAYRRRGRWRREASLTSGPGRLCQALGLTRRSAQWA